MNTTDRQAATERVRAALAQGAIPADDDLMLCDASLLREVQNAERRCNPTAAEPILRGSLGIPEPVWYPVKP